MLVVLLAVVLPSVCFAVRDSSEDRDSGLDTAADTGRRRGARGAKAGALAAAVLVALLLVGLFVRTGAAAYGSGVTNRWFDVLAGLRTGYEEALGFVVGVLALAALVLVGAPAAYGLTALPLRVMLGGRRAHAAAAAAAQRAAQLREQERALTARYAGGQRMGRADRRALAALRTERRVHEKRAARVAHSSGGLSSMCGGRLEPWVRPLRVAAGVVLLALGAFVVASAVVAQLDAQQHSVCGAACGYLVERPRWRSPVDALLARLAPLFPLDAAVLAALALYGVAAAHAGLRDLAGSGSSESALGRVLVRVLGGTRLRARGVGPAGVGVLALATALALLGTTQGLLALAPQYTAFGAQRYAEEGSSGGGAAVWRACTLAGDLRACHVAQTAGMLRVAGGVTHSVLGAALHYATWAVLAAALALAPVAVHRARTRRVSYGTTLDGDDALVNDDGTALADSDGASYGAVVV